jgi:hypothetical protein
MMLINLFIAHLLGEKDGELNDTTILLFRTRTMGAECIRAKKTVTWRVKLRVLHRCHAGLVREGEERQSVENIEI